LTAMVVIVSLLMVLERVKARTLERESLHLRMEIDRLRYSNGLLEMQIHQWTAPTHLDFVARKEFGMAPAKLVQQEFLK